jgi:nucleotide-binding universal stress UspA family protein
MKILLAVDESEGSQAATQMVIAQAKPNETQILVVHVVDVLRNQLPGMSIHYRGVERERDAQRQCATELAESTANVLRKKGLPVSTAIEWGDPKSEIVSAARRWQADLIVIGSRQRQGLSRMFVGHVAEGVLRNADCSVEVARTHTELEKSRLAITFDRSPVDRQA